MRLSPRQRDTLDVIRGWTETFGYPPTLRELARELGIGSTNGVNDHLKALKKKGFIETDPVKARGIRILETPNAPIDPVATRRLMAEDDVARRIANWLATIVSLRQNDEAAPMIQQLAGMIRQGHWRGSVSIPPK
jgi:SOS-response transcriptional repressor LexA